jgi:hypothetical protein
LAVAVAVAGGKLHKAAVVGTVAAVARVVIVLLRVFLLLRVLHTLLLWAQVVMQV